LYDSTKFRGALGEKMVLTEIRLPSSVQISSQAKKTAPFPSDWKLWETEVSKLVARAWLDSDFCDSFVADPAGTLQEAGLVLEDFVEGLEEWPKE